MQEKSLNKRFGNITTKLMLAGGVVTTASTFMMANYLVDRITKVPPPNGEDLYSFSPFETCVDYEEIKFSLKDERVLSGWIFPRPQSNKVIVTCHGYGGRREDMLGIGSFLWRNGFNVVLFECRGCGKNRGKGDIRTLGHRELEDFQAAVAYTKARFRKEGKEPIIGVLGGSQGAAVALVAAANDPEIKAIWADSSFVDRRAIISHNWQTASRLPAKPVIDVADRIFERRTGQKMAEFSPLNALSRIKSPIYFVHGGSDTTTPVEQCHKLYAAAQSPKELWVLPEAWHCGVYFLERAGYCQRAVEFFNRYLV
jgi:uncharacterized protein